MKKKNKETQGANNQSAPIVLGDNLRAAYSVIVTNGIGKNAFTIEGHFDLAAAMHPAMIYSAQEDFELLLTRAIVNPAKTMMTQFMNAVREAERNGGSVWNPVTSNEQPATADATGLPKELTPDAKAFLDAVQKGMAEDFKTGRLPEIPTIVGEPVPAT